MARDTGRRSFLKTVALAGSATAPAAPGQAEAAAKPQAPAAASSRPSIQYPRVFRGRQLAMLAFPLGGVAAGSISLGGRGQLRDWEIFNRPDKGRSPTYAFPSIWAQVGGGKPVARVLEARLAPPYERARGLGPENAPGLPRLEAATFTGEYPVATITFRDRRLPVKVALEAFTPFIPLDAEDSGLPVAILRYKVSNPGKDTARVAIAFSIDNPVGPDVPGRARQPVPDRRANEYRVGHTVQGLFMTNPELAAADPEAGTFALCVAEAGDGRLSYLRGWPRTKWRASPMLYWDDFSADGALGPEPELRNAVGSVCLEREIAPGAEAAFTFLLAWRFPNRTPARCGWSAPPGEENTVIGNHYCARFRDAWEAAEYAAARLAPLEERTRQFLAAMRETTLPAAVKEAAMANLSTLVTQTCFRTADGNFRGFEGIDDQRGCCFGNCTHVWNYESATSHLFPALARTMREAAFRLAGRLGGQMPIRIQLPEGKQTSGVAAADGQMGQIIKAYLDWQLWGDEAWLRRLWPQVKQALEFAWTPGGWDADRDGVMEGVQHNTYDVEFFGPNPMCGIYYLGALRAGERMARAVGDEASAREYRRLCEQGSQWIDRRLFNGEYYVQQIRGVPRDKVAKGLLSSMGSDDTEKPDFQLGEGCLVDQLVGQYVAEFAGLGALVEPANIRRTLQAIYKYNYKPDLYEHESLQRIYALNDEAALVICDYGRAQRPKIPFPYFAEVMTGFEYTAAMLMLYYGMVKEGLECIENVRRRYDGERRNPWDEAECGHHYARAMAAWTGILALSGFRYQGSEERVSVAPRLRRAAFSSFWSTATGWGKFLQTTQEQRLRFTLGVSYGRLKAKSVELARSAASRAPSSAMLGERALKHELRREAGGVVFQFPEAVEIREGEELVLTA